MITSVSHEAVIDAIGIDLMSNGFRSLLDEVWAQGLVPLPVRYPEICYTAEKRLSQLDRFPAIEVVSTRQELAEESTAEQSLHRLVVMVTDIGDDEEVVARVLRRYGHALIAFLNGRNLYPIMAGVIRVQAVDYSPIATPINNAGIIQSVAADIVLDSFGG